MEELKLSCEAQAKTISELVEKNKSLEERLRTNKVFIYMIIHDLKHPTECINASLNHLETELNSML